MVSDSCVSLKKRLLAGKRFWRKALDGRKALAARKALAVVTIRAELCGVTPLSRVANMVKKCATCIHRWQQDVSLIRAHQVSHGLPLIPLCRGCAAEIGYGGIPCNWPGGCTTLAQSNHGHRCSVHSLEECEVIGCDTTPQFGVHGHRCSVHSLQECEVDGCDTTPQFGVHGHRCQVHSLQECEVDRLRHDSEVWRPRSSL